MKKTSLENEWRGKVKQKSKKKKEKRLGSLRFSFLVLLLILQFIERMKVLLLVLFLLLLSIAWMCVRCGRKEMTRLYTQRKRVNGQYNANKKKKVTRQTSNTQKSTREQSGKNRGPNHAQKKIQDFHFSFLVFAKERCKKNRKKCELLYPRVEFLFYKISLFCCLD